MRDMTNRLKMITGSVAAVVALLLAFWGTWAFAYHRGFDYGYARGGGEEFLRWRQEPMRTERDLEGMIVTGHRNMREKAAVIVSRGFTPRSVNAWAAPFTVIGAVSVSGGGATVR